jgi:hypothetical protein
MRDKQRPILLIGGGICFLGLLTTMVIDIAIGGWSNSLLFVVLAIVVSGGLFVVGLRQGRRN